MMKCVETVVAVQQQENFKFIPGSCFKRLKMSLSGPKLVQNIPSVHSYSEHVFACWKQLR